MHAPHGRAQYVGWKVPANVRHLNPSFTPASAPLSASKRQKHIQKVFRNDTRLFAGKYGLPTPQTPATTLLLLVPLPSRCPLALLTGSSDIQLTVSVGETTIDFALPREEAVKLSTAVGGCLQTFADKQKAERPKRWPNMEFRFKGKGRE